jgi:hypothetical protein
VRFYLGTAWPNYFEQTDVPLCVSALTLKARKRMPKARGPWILDSGAFTQISGMGRFEMEAKEYARLAQRCMDEIGHLDGAAIQDWMCEPFVLAKTGKTIAEHQKLTCESFSELRYHAPDVSWVPVLQGYFYEDYLAHLELYAEYDDDLSLWPVVGVGSICRRQSTGMVEGLLIELSRRGLRLHGFGLKELALRRIGYYLHSSDSMAWSFRARRENFKLPTCTHTRCTNCLPNALRWREKVVAGINQKPMAAVQTRLLQL